MSLMAFETLRFPSRNLRIWIALVGLALGYKEVTIHINGYSTFWQQLDSNTWPCLDMSPYGQHIHINHYGCSRRYIQGPRSRILWQVPEGQGPIRLAAKPEMCVDASEAISFLRRSESCSNNNSLQSVLQRVVTLNRCDGSASQQFFVEYGESAIIRLAAHPAWALTFDVAAVTLENACQAHSPRFGFSFVEFQYSNLTFLLGGDAGAYDTLQCVHAFKMLLTLAYVGLFTLRVCQFRVGSAMASLQKAWHLCVRPVEAKVRNLVIERRLRRAQHVLSLALHAFFVFWMIRVGVVLPWQWQTEISDESRAHAAWKLAAHGHLPLMSVTTLCFYMRLRPVHNARVLDALTILFSCIWSAQYYMMSQNLGSMNTEVYLFNESWMLIARTLLNMTIGKVSIAVPCTILVTMTDVYAFSNLAPLYRSPSYPVRYYVLKQSIICSMACAMHYCVERLAFFEAQSTSEVQRAELHEQLATRLTIGMCDAVVHLDGDLKFSKPAPKLARILFRRDLGATPTPFLNIVREIDHQRFKDHLEYVKESDMMEPLVPLHFSLLDTSAACCRVRMYASAYRDSEQAMHYILGFAEIEDIPHRPAPTEQNTAIAADIFGKPMQDSIPEGSALESDSDASHSSIFSKDISRLNHVSFHATVSQSSGTIVSCDAALGEFMKKELAGVYFPSLFHESSAVWAWLQTMVDDLRSDVPLSLEERTSGAFVAQPGKSRYDVRVIVDEIGSAHDGSPTINLTMRIENRHKRKVKPQSRISRLLGSTSEDMAVVGHVAVRASASHLDLALDTAQRSSERVFKPLLKESWVDWQTWWNDCMLSIEEMPFRTSRGNLSMEAHRCASREYIVSMHLRIPENSASFVRLTKGRVPKATSSL
eukprot:TRINITY_DN10251_c0_g3_i1.p1 TRINITY_DN10251_c0_g3~~TRINITY_DN10251_c0_g3_i1.p1  ORF type:complete len:876 (-),score=46.58 TRINITY_DN10251_c0_g3_i1:106-2733(-)